MSWAHRARRCTGCIEASHAYCREAPSPLRKCGRGWGVQMVTPEWSQAPADLGLPGLPGYLNRGFVCGRRYPRKRPAPATLSFLPLVPTETASSVRGSLALVLEAGNDLLVGERQQRPDARGERQQVKQHAEADA